MYTDLTLLCQERNSNLKTSRDFPNSKELVHQKYKYPNFKYSTDYYTTNKAKEIFFPNPISPDKDIRNSTKHAALVYTPPDESY